jgi:beta-xylosidase
VEKTADSVRASNIEKVSVSLNAAPVKALKLPKKIFKIGRLSEALRETVKNQLMAVQEKLAGDYVYFKGVFDDGIANYSLDSIFMGCEHDRLFAFFRKIGLFPFVRLDLSYAPQDAFGRLRIDGSLSRLRTFMEVLTSSQPSGYWEGCFFEVVHSKPIDATGFMECYASIYSLLKGYSCKIGVGLHSLGDTGARNDVFEEQLILCGNGRCGPDFVTLTVNPETEFEGGVLSPLSYRAARSGARAQIERVRHIINDSGALTMETHVIEWINPLRSAPLELAASFRIAAMASNLLEHGDMISGAAYWLNCEPKGSVSDEPDNRMPGLFARGMIKRPQYHLLWQMDKLRGDILYQDGEVTVIKKNDGEYAVVTYNPGPFNRVCRTGANGDAMENAHDPDAAQLDVEITLTDIPSGRYRSRSFLWDDSQGRILDELKEDDYAGINGKDVVERLESAGIPKMETCEEDVSGTYSFTQSLAQNAVSLRLIQRVF